jgi:hypothetical protein
MTKAISTFNPNAAMPAFIPTGDAGAGNKNVTNDDMTVPRMNLLQLISHELKKTSPKYIEGAEAGKIVNTLNKEMFDHVHLVNLYYDREFTIFNNNRQFVGTFNSLNEAQAYLTEHGLKDADNNIVDTGRHTCMQLAEDGTQLGTVVVLMSGSKQRVSNEWNTQLAARSKTEPRYASIWRLDPSEEANSRGDTYFNYALSFAGYVDESTYADVKAMSDILSS